MGVIRRMGPAATGAGPVMVTAHRLISEIERRAEEGLTECVVSFGQTDIGDRNSLDFAATIIVDQIHAAGHTVSAVDLPTGSWSDTVNVTVRPKQPVQPAPDLAAAEAPDLAHLHRRVVGTDARQPVGNAAAAMSSRELGAESRWLRQELDTGHDDSCWRRRCELGFALQTEGMDQPDQFWLDAAPALAALRLGSHEHRLARLCASSADRLADWADPQQVTAVEELSQYF